MGSTAQIASPTSTISVVIVDDHPLVREGLGRIAASHDDLAVVGECESVEHALGLGVTDVDVVLLDLNLPGTGGLEGIPLLHAKWPDARVLIITVHSETTHGSAAAARGAAGFVSKSASPAEIAAAIRAVAAGESHFASGGGSDRSPTSISLTPRECEVLQMLADGVRVSDIAERLQLSVKTASAHKMRLQRKIGATNTAQLALIARALGLVD